VVEESKRRPVVVDFWAEWCAPCRMIGPVLERLADEHDGAFLLGKLDVDANPQASMAFRIQSIPAVKAFINGQLATEFIGAIPEASIRQFLDSILPTEADQLAMQGFEELAAGREAEAEARSDRLPRPILAPSAPRWGWPRSPPAGRRRRGPPPARAARPHPKPSASWLASRSRRGPTSRTARGRSARPSAPRAKVATPRPWRVCWQA
jgi:thioredoxin